MFGASHVVRGRKCVLASATTERMTVVGSCEPATAMDTEKRARLSSGAVLFCGGHPPPLLLGTAAAWIPSSDLDVGRQSIYSQSRTSRLDPTHTHPHPLPGTPGWHAAP